ncbi:GntR family transcriptional regulator [uncultured Croceitalea sp.]|uniref:GntR family transcriptional regulator n=1 Tax=uncultured Croceitalea sp. TaxID=1798908 RepID=UPI003305FA4C
MTRSFILLDMENVMLEKRKYQIIFDYLKEGIQTKKYGVDSYLPSENEICNQFKTTRTTVRKALDELQKDGFITKEQGKGSKVLERRKSLGLLTVKGFSQAVDHKVKTVLLKRPSEQQWDPSISFDLTSDEEESKCIYFQRLRYLDDQPVMLENNWYAANALEPMKANEFVDGSFFKTLSQKYLIEIMGSEQELRAELANEYISDNLGIKQGAPVLHISVRFKTSKADLNLYSEIYCNTAMVPIRNSYFL